MLKPTPRVNQSDQDPGVPSLTLRALLEAEESNLLRYAFYLTGRRAVAEEIVQDVFLQLYKRWNEVSNPKAWLFRSVRNKAFNHLRDYQHEILRDDDGVAEVEQAEESPGRLLENIETAATLRKLLQELNETDQALVKLKYFDGLKYREISEQTGLSVSNVGYRLHHILKELAGKLRPFGIDEAL